MFLGILSFFWRDIKELVHFLELFLWDLMWVAGLIMLCIKIAGVGIHGAIVSVPFHIILIISGYFIMKKKRFCDDDFCFERISSLPLLVLISIFMILLVIQIETNVFWSWHTVFIPLYIFDGLFTIYVIFPIVACICDIAPDDFLDYDNRTMLAIWTATMLFFIGPLFIFKILLGLTLDGSRDYTFAGIFAPIYVIESIATILYFFIWAIW